MFAGDVYNHPVLDYPRRIMAVIQQVMGPKLQDSLLNCRFTYASIFAGMGCVEEGMTLMKKEANKLGLQMEPVLLYQCEKHRGCGDYLMTDSHNHGDSDSCLFANVCDLAPIKEDVRQRSMSTYMSRSVRGKMAKFAWCRRHCRKCPVPQAVDVVAGGNPCTDWSLSGNRLGFDGPTRLATLSFGRVLASSGLGLEENVERFPDIYEEAMTDWKCKKLIVRPGDIGYANVIQRKRCYRGLLHKNVKRLFSPGALYQAIVEEFSGDQTHFAELLDPDMGTEKDFQELSKMKKIMLHRYKVMSSRRGRLKRDCVYHLGDNPHKRLCWSSPQSSALPTLRRSMGVLWCSAKRRKLRVRELARMQGWRRPLNVASDSLFQSMLGNSMHVANVTAVIAVHLACTPASIRRTDCTRRERTSQELVRVFEEAVARAGA